MSDVTSLPARGPDVPGCLDYSFDLDVGELACGHRVITRGICLHGGALVLRYEFAPGVTAGEERRTGLLFDADYDAYVPTSYDGAMLGAMARLEGGATTAGSRSFPLPPPQARRVWFDFFAAGDDGNEHRVSRLTIDLASGQAWIEK